MPTTAKVRRQPLFGGRQHRDEIRPEGVPEPEAVKMERTRERDGRQSSAVSAMDMISRSANAGAPAKPVARLIQRRPVALATSHHSELS